jgi:hypothetical protein
MVVAACSRDTGKEQQTVKAQAAESEPERWPTRLAFHEGEYTGYIDESGAVVIPPTWWLANDFQEGLAHFRDRANRRYGFIDTSGRVAIPATFDIVGAFSEGRAVFGVREAGPPNDRGFRGDLDGYIDRQGRVVVPAQYCSAWPYSEGLAAVETCDGEVYFLDLEGNIALRDGFRSAFAFRDGLVVVSYLNEEDGVSWLIDRQGKRMKRREHYIWSGSRDGWYVAVKTEETAFRPGGRYFVDRMGEVVLPGPFKEADGFQEGLAAVQEGELWGFIDKTGSMVIPAQFFTVDSFSEGWASVAIQPEDEGPLLWGAIDKSGRYVLEPRFSSLCRFEKGLACAHEVVDGQHYQGYINREGEWIFRRQCTPSR